MLNNFYKRQKLLSWKARVVIGLVAFCFCLFPIKWDNVQYLLLSGFVLLGLFLHVNKKKPFSLEFRRIDYFWFFFLVIGGLSFFWSNNGSLVWFQFFGFALQFLLVIITRSIWAHEDYRDYFKDIVYFAFLSFLIGAFAFCILFDDAQGAEWNKIFGYNANYTCSYGVALCSIIFFSKERTYYFYKVSLLVIFLTYLLYIGSSKASFIAFLIILLFSFFDRIHKKYFVIFSASSLISLYVIFLFNGKNLSVFQEIEISSRLNMIRASWLMFVEQPLLGIGMGNWNTEVEQFDFYYHSRHLGNHNLYFQYLAELGIFGLLSYIAPFISSMYYFFKNTERKKNSQFVALSIVIVYLIASFFYYDVNIYPFNFTKLCYLAAMSLGILTYYTPNIRTVSDRFVIGLVFILSVLTFTFFAYNKITYTFFVNRIERNVKPSKEKILTLETIFHPVFKTNHDRNTSIAHLLARQNLINKNFEKAYYYYFIAHENNPYNREILTMFPELLYHHIKETSKAEELAKQAILLSSKIPVRSYLLLTEIAIDQNRFTEAFNYLDYTSNYRKPYFLLLQQKLIYKFFIKIIFENKSNSKRKKMIDFNNQFSKVLEQYRSLFLNGELTLKKSRVFTKRVDMVLNKYEKFIIENLNEKEYTSYKKLKN